jgi:type III pantothenate kinase
MFGLAPPLLPLLAIDAGNTRLKATWLLQSGTQQISYTYNDPGAASAIAERTRALGIQHVGIGSVVGHQLPIFRELAAALPACTFHTLLATTPGKIVNAYATPDTLGADRWLAMHGARSLCPTGRLLVIDLGTALTYDYLTDDDRYLGGGISPGLNLRFQALHSHTARLPLLALGVAQPKLIGTTTAESIASGVENGLLFELQGTQNAYRALAETPLQTIVTGGDAPRFENLLEKPIFASPHLVALGIALLVGTRVYGKTPFGPASLQ